MSSWMNPCPCAGQSAFGQDADRKQAHELVSTFPSPWRWWHGVKERLEEMEKTVMTDTGPREFAGVKLSTRASQGLPPETITLRQVREFICKHSRSAWWTSRTSQSVGTRDPSSGRYAGLRYQSEVYMSAWAPVSGVRTPRLVLCTLRTSFFSLNKT